MPARTRRLLLGAFAVACVVFAAFPLSIHLKRPAAEWEDRAARRLAAWPLPVHVTGSQNKDYGLWYPVGLVARSDTPLYDPRPGVPFPFMYPPFAGAVLAWVSHLGSTGMIVVLVLANVAAWLLAVVLGVRLAAGPGPAPPLVWWLPSALCLFFVYDMFLLGQPNLGLLALMLAGYHLLRAGRQGWAGAAFAAAAALKAFPAVVLVYLLWRRYWLAAASMALVTAGLLVLVPVPTRGWDRNLSELRAWADGMIFTGGAGGVGQRPEQSLGWRNQSLLGVGHRLLRPVNVEAEAFDAPRELYVNLLSLDYRTASLAVYAACGLVGLGFAAVLPRPAARTRQSDAAEFALLTILVVVGTPYAFGYYFVWLLFPATVLVWFAACDPAPAARRAAWATLGLGFGLLLVGSPVTGSRVPAAAGAPLAGALALAAGLGWQVWRLGRGKMASEGVV
jgi:hypothetical protein